MKVYYNSRLAKLLTFMEGFSTMMLFGAVVTEKDALSVKSLKHEETHSKQYTDCFGLGLGIGIILMFILFAFEIQSWWMLLLIAIPVFLYYVLYGVEYLCWRLRGFNRNDAYMNIGFERQARYIADTWNLPCEQQRQYVSFRWWAKDMG